MLKLTFLGTTSGIPSKERGHPALVLEYFGRKKHTLLFDCGEATQLKLMQAGISFMQVSKIFITHWHADHFAGLVGLLATMNLEKRKDELKIFAPEAEKFVPRILSLGYFGLKFPVRWVEVPWIGEALTKIDEGQEYEIFSTPVLHTVPSVAFCFKEKDSWSIDPQKLRKLKLPRGAWLKRLKKFGKASIKGREVKIEEVANLKPGLKVVYTGDTKPCANVEKLAEHADLLIHDATFLEPDESLAKGHADVTQAARIAKKAGAKLLVLTNISRRYRSPEEIEEKAKKVFENCKVAYDLMELKLKKA